MKNYTSAVFTIAALAGTIYLTSCKTKQPAPTASTTTTAASVTYTADIKPILDAACATTCHSAEKHKHNIDLSTYESTKEIAKSKSFLGSIRHEEGYDAMPAKADKLDNATIEKIANWVQGGMAK